MKDSALPFTLPSTNVEAGEDKIPLSRESRERISASLETLEQTLRRLRSRCDEIAEWKDNSPIAQPSTDPASARKLAHPPDDATPELQLISHDEMAPAERLALGEMLRVLHASRN